MGLIGRPLLYYPDRPATASERKRAERLRLKEELTTLRRKLAQKVYHSDKRQDWETPWHVFDPYNDEFAFTLDVCAEAHTRKCARYFSLAQDGLAQDWGREICWMNPPYGRKGQIDQWMEKAYRSSLAGATVVCLVASRTGSGWWHDWVLGKATEVRLRRGRIRFVGAKDQAGFPSVAVIYRPVPCR